MEIFGISSFFHDKIGQQYGNQLIRERTDFFNAIPILRNMYHGETIQKVDLIVRHFLFF